MNVPTRHHTLGAELSCAPCNVAPRVLQAHFIKHVMGMDSLWAITAVPSRRPWNREGWDSTVPVVLTVIRRREISRQIQALEADGKSCSVDRLHKEELGGPGNNQPMPCYQCPVKLVSACQQVSRKEVGAYLSQVDSSLQAMADSVAVSHDTLSLLSLANLRNPKWFDGLTVVSLQRPPARSEKTKPNAIIRISSANGVRSEFYRFSGGRLRWRTTYRQPLARVADTHRVLISESRPHRISNQPLSDAVLVPRLWWERQQ